MDKLKYGREFDNSKHCAASAGSRKVSWYQVCNCYKDQAPAAAAAAAAAAPAPSRTFMRRHYIYSHAT